MQNSAIWYYIIKLCFKKPIVAVVDTKLMIMVICGGKRKLRGRGNWRHNSIYNAYFLILYSLSSYSLYFIVVEALLVYHALI